MYSAIDLFSGAGGFSLGIENAGIRVVAAVDNDQHAVEAYRHNFPKHSVWKEDLHSFTPRKMSKSIGLDSVDVIIGGPPCQGFSQMKVGNHGERIVKDDRRNLHLLFFKYVSAFKPRIFVMENVPGIKTAVNGEVFKEIMKQAQMCGYKIHTELLRAWNFGVPQKRSRQIIVGFRKDIHSFEGDKWVRPTHTDYPDKDECLERTTTLWEAIGDLPRLKAGKSTDSYDLQRREKFASTHDDRYIAEVAQVYKSNALTGHLARPHMERDLRDFARLREGESSETVLKRGVEMEFPYNREKFKDRYTRQHRNRLSSTIVAHLSKDGLMFIHPTQLRSLTPREAARIQSFPDCFDFPVPRTHQFRLIGNAVPPLMGKAIACAIIEHLRGVSGKF